MSRSNRKLQPAHASEIDVPPLPGRQVLESRVFASRRITACLSESAVDPAWDSFLQSSSQGQFQQSSLWARVKAREGWKSFRVTFEEEGEMVAGFQILHKARGLIRQGFLNKGPVELTGVPEIRQWVVDLIKEVSRSHGLTILFVQASDEGGSAYETMLRSGFLPDGLTHVHDATLITALGGEKGDWTVRMRKTTQQEVRQSAKRGAVIREGGAGDVAAFFGLMEITCRRQGVAPNPSTPASLQNLFDVFHSQGLARLSFADCDGHPTAGVLCIRFGNRVTLWKKGWNEKHRDKHPSSLVCHESMMWATSTGAEIYDFVAASRAFCTALSQGRALAEIHQASRYFFLLGFGAEPRLLPPCLIWLPGAHFRLPYSAAIPLLKKLGRIHK